MVLLEFSMSPLGKGESVGKYVARSLEMVDKSGVDYRLNPMGTVLEGDWDDVCGVVTQCFTLIKLVLGDELAEGAVATLDLADQGFTLAGDAVQALVQRRVACQPSQAALGLIERLGYLLQFIHGGGGPVKERPVHDQLAQRPFSLFDPGEQLGGLVGDRLRLAEERGRVVVEVRVGHELARGAFAFLQAGENC